MRNAYIRVLNELAGQDETVLALVADNGAIIYDEFRKKFPGRFINFGISEMNMIAAAAGIASTGFKPFAYTISNFLTMRAFEMIRNDVCMQKQNVKLVGIGCGMAYSNLGPTHHGTEDLALMRCLPGMTVFSPGSPAEIEYATRAAYEINGPVYLRVGRNKTEEFCDTNYEFIPGAPVPLTEDGEITLFATGSIINESLRAAEKLKKDGIQLGVVNIHTLKPVDEIQILKFITGRKAVITLEEHSVTGGLGSLIAEIMAENGSGIKLNRMGLKNSFAKGYGDTDFIKKNNGLSAEDIIMNVNKIISIRNKY